MKYFIDTEFIENGSTIELISIGIVNENGGEFYAVNKGFNRAAAFENGWLVENVLPRLPIIRMADSPLTYASFLEDYSHPAWMGREAIRAGILNFIGDDSDPEFWAYYADYDWVVFCQLWGKMVDLPRGFPCYCNDLRQLMNHYPTVTKPADPEDEHDALVDARWNKQFYELLTVRTGPALTLAFKPAFQPGNQVYVLSSDETVTTIFVGHIISAVGRWDGKAASILYEVEVAYSFGQRNTHFLPQTIVFESQSAAREGLVERVRRTANVVGLPDGVLAVA